jgi:hypothetical protein
VPEPAPPREVTAPLSYGDVLRDLAGSTRIPAGLDRPNSDISPSPNFLATWPSISVTAAAAASRQENDSERAVRAALTIERALADLAA